MFFKTSDQEDLKLGVGEYRCNWGSHFAGLYETEAERDSIIFGYLRDGYEDGNLQLYCPSERSLEDFTDSFSKACPHCREALKSKEYFQFYTARELYYPRGVFSAHLMDKGLNDFYHLSQNKRRRHIRATAEMVWALEAVPGVEELMIYESRLNYFIEGKPWISICLYNINKFDGKTIMNVLRTHPYTISKGIITANPFYQPPEKWLKDNAPEYLKP